MRKIISSSVFLILSFIASAQTAQEWFDKAMQQVNEKQFAEAIESCNKALALNPDFAEAYNRRGYTSYLMKEYDKTIADCSKAIALDAQLAKAYYNRGMAYYKKQNDQMALPDLRKVMQLNEGLVKDNPTFYSSLGYAAYITKNYEESLMAYNKAIALKPDNGSYFATRGTAKYLLKQYDAAIADFNEAIKLSPDLAYSYYNRANVNYVLKKYKEAYTDYKKAIELDAKSANIDNYSNYGYSAYIATQYNDCIAAYDKAIAIEPANASYYRLRGTCKQELKSYNEAISDYSEAMKLGDTYIGMWSGRGWCYYETKQYDKAIPDYNVYLKQFPEEHTAYNIRALCYHNLSKWAESLKDLDEAVRLKPTEPIYINNRAYSHYMLGNYEKAFNDYEACKRIGGKDFVIYYFYWDEALLKYVQQPSPSADIIYNNAMALLKLKPKKGFIKEVMNAALAKFPNDGRFYLVKYIAMKQDVDFGADRVTAIEKAAQLLPNDAAANYHLGFERFLANRDSEAKALYDKSMALGGNYLVAENAKDLGNGNYKQVIINRETGAYQTQQTVSNNNNMVSGMSNETALRAFANELIKGMTNKGFKIAVSEYCSNVQSNTTQLTRQPGATINYGDAISIVIVSSADSEIRLLTSHNSPCTGNVGTGMDEVSGPFKVKQCSQNSPHPDQTFVWYNITSFNKSEFFYFVGTYSSQN